MEITIVNVLLGLLEFNVRLVEFSLFIFFIYFFLFLMYLKKKIRCEL